MNEIYNKENVRNISIDNIKWRLFSFQIQSDAWIYDLRFSNHNQLYKFLIKKQPKNCYHSVSLYNPYNHFKRFKSEFIIDFDTVSIKDLKKAELLFGEPKRIVRTSKRGVHLFYDLMPYRWALVNYLKENKVNFDYRTSINRDRIVRIPFSYNGNKNNWSHAFASMQNLEEELSKDSNDMQNLSVEKIRKEDNLPNPLPSTFFFRFITQKCKKSYIFFKRFRNNKLPLKRLKIVQNRFNLGDLYIIDYGKEKAVMSLKTFSKRRLQKIDKMIKIHGIIRTSAYFDKEGNKYYEAPKKLMVLEGNRLNHSDYSRFHAYFLKSLGFNIDLECKRPTLFTGKFGFEKGG